ncbi:hypothetical protein ACFL9T_00125 [Thermodesulfobacteriota bacterium]
MKTELCQYPMILRMPEALRRFVECNKEFFGRKPKNNDDGTLLLNNAHPFVSYYNLSDDGSYYNFYDIPRGTTQEYKRLKIFCEKERMTK